MSPLLPLRHGENLSLAVSCDVAVPMGIAKATVAMVVRNDPGEIIDGSTSSFFSSSVLHGELGVIRKACFMGLELRANPMVIESDGKVAITYAVCV